jgi:hypothetical protein
MPKTYRTKPSADEIADKASRGEDISAYFTNKFTVVRPVYRVNVDLTRGMLRELDERAARLNVSRQAVIKTLLGRALEEERPSKPDRRGSPARLAIYHICRCYVHPPPYSSTVRRQRRVVGAWFPGHIPVAPYHGRERKCWASARR